MLETKCTFTGLLTEPLQITYTYASYSFCLIDKMGVEHQYFTNDTYVGFAASKFYASFRGKEKFGSQKGAGGFWGGVFGGLGGGGVK